MKLYKYRAVSDGDEGSFVRLADILHKNAFWCAAPATLNDPEEFTWQCDYEPSLATTSLLAELLVAHRGSDFASARAIALGAVAGNRIAALAAPIFQSIIDQCRAEIGLACFGTSFDSPVMWQRYGGDGTGVCIEIDAPDELLDNQLHRVEYPISKILTIDQLLQASLGGAHKRTVYSISLLSKPPGWAEEAEVRFISKQQGVSVHLAGSTIARVILGSRVDSNTKTRVQNLVSSLAYPIPLSYHSS